MANGKCEYSPWTHTRVTEEEREFAARLTVHGLRARDGVAAKEGDYTRAERLGVDVRCLLIETWGGLSPEMVELLLELSRFRRNRLTHAEYDETTWAARSWRTFAGHKISVAVQRAAALEIARALKLSTATDPRARDGPAAAAA